MFSKATEYALRATIFIAQKGTEDNKIGMEKSPKPLIRLRHLQLKYYRHLERIIKLSGLSVAPMAVFI